MSKKKFGKENQRKRFPWAPTVIGGMLLIIAIAAFFLARQGSGDGSGTPSITVDQQEIDYGDVKFGVNKTFAIRVTNSGDGTLRFREDPYIEVLEGC